VIEPESTCPELAQDEWQTSLPEDLATMEGLRFSDLLQQRCLRRLAQAWEDLNFRHLRCRLRSPSLQLHTSERRWGTWYPARRLITISRRQVLCYTWQSVVETLKHEMAHQYVSEVMHLDALTQPHGPAFQQACRLLACDSAARGGGGVPLFRPGGAGASATADDTRLARIQKLLALADNNPDEHEARAAFARASDLMLKYNLDAVSHGPPGPRDYTHRVLGQTSGRVAHHRYLVASLLQEFYFVQCIWVDSYAAHRGVAGHVLEVLGTRANVDMAEYVHDSLLRQSEALWLAYKREHQIKDRRAKRQYLDGLLNGFRRQLRRTQQQSAERGLVWVGDPALDEVVKARYPRTTRSSIGAADGSAARAAGVAAGERLRLHRPVTGGSTGGREGRLLPAPRR
jgi:Protein of unknown function (DUF2786)/SprT-like family